MRKIGFVVDSTFGEQIEDVSVVRLTVDVDGKEYVDGFIKPEIIVKALEEKKHIKTSQPNPTAFIEAINEQLEKGYEQIICLTISSGLSGTFNSANLAKKILNNDNVYVISTQTVNIGSKYILEKAIEYSEDHTIEEVLKYIDYLISKGSVIFSVDELGTLVKNGRLSRTAALIGNILRIKPILRYKNNHLEVEAKVRRFQGVLKYITEQVENMLDKLKVIVRITYVNNEDYAISMKEAIETVNHKNNVEVKIMDILTPVVSAHVGLGGMGIYLTYE
ncbi:MAG TPA: DegV family protein [Acholeplasmataceae bacterium]|nr:DegV family protein [Acholeplasmataceae bacterium]